MNEQAGLVGAIVAIGFSIQKQTAASSPAHSSSEETWEVCEGEGGDLVFAIEHIQLAVVPVETEGYGVPTVGPVVIGANIKVILKHPGIRKIVGGTDAQSLGVAGSGIGDGETGE